MERLAPVGLDGTMLDGTPRTLTIVAAVAAGIVAGVFFAFSTFVMPALRRLPADRGLVAMQSINRAAPASPLFMLALMGTAALCVGLGVLALTRLDEPAAPWLLAGCGLYLAAVVVTVAFHVPRNDALGLLDPAASGSADAWRHYLTVWTAGNHVRSLVSAAASASFVVALVAT
jgi:uncharacterized membrane protein